MKSQTSFPRLVLHHAPPGGGRGGGMAGGFLHPAVEQGGCLIHFFANDCPQTSRYFQEIGGDEDRKVTSAHFQRVPPPPRFRLPNHEFVETPSEVLTGHVVDTRKQSRFSSAELGGLPNGTAPVVTKGRKLVRYQMNPQASHRGVEKVEGLMDGDV